MKTFGVVVLTLILMVQAASIAKSKDAKEAQKDKKADSNIQANTPVKGDEVFRPRAKKVYLQRPWHQYSGQPRWSNKPAGFKDKKAAVKEKGVDKGVKSVQSNGPQLGKAGQSSHKWVKKRRKLFSTRSLLTCAFLMATL